jgi:uncharacterized protein (TIGR00299 family) protein
MNETDKRILYIDCFSGISGDMFLGALLDLGINEKKIINKISGILPSEAKIKIRKEKRGNFTGKKFEVEVSKKAIKERHLKDIKKLLDDSKLEKKILQKSKEMFEELAEVEAEIHGVSKEKIHFHELGAIDSIADIAGAVIAIELLKVNKIYFSPINVGTGSTKIEHGRVPLPVPATAELLKRCRAPVYSTGINSELVTPTGALIIKHFSDSFSMPRMKIQNIGIGFGSKELKESPNFLRVIIGTLEKEYSENEVLIETNIDDMNPEFLPSVEKKLLLSGALDVFRTPIQMKKGRGGFILSVLCERKNIDKIADILFHETTTIGVRIHSIERRKLNRKSKKIKTKFGEAEVKLAYLNGKLVNISPEFDSCEKLAEKTGLPVKEIYDEVKEAANKLFKKSGARIEKQVK